MKFNDLNGLLKKSHECKDLRGITHLSMVNKIIVHMYNEEMTIGLQGRGMNSLDSEPTDPQCFDHIKTLPINVEQFLFYRLCESLWHHRSE